MFRYYLKIFLSIQVFVYLYLSFLLSGEHYLLGWDSSTYYGATKALALAFSEGFNNGMSLLYRQGQSTHNSYFALPIVPFFLGVGISPHVFIQSIGCIYLAPLIFVSIFLCNATIKLKSSKGRAVVEPILAVIFMPLLWVVSLGYKADVGGLIFIFYILYILFKDPYLHHLRSAIQLILFTSLVLLFRRHFAFTVLAIYSACSIFYLLDGIFKKEYSRVIIQGSKLFLIAIFSMLMMYFIAPGYTQQFVVNNYSDAYSGYRHSIDVLLQYWLGFYGGGALVFALIGYVWGAGKGIVKSSVLFIMPTQALLWVAFWVYGASYKDFHHGLNSILLFTIVGNFIYLYLLFRSLDSVSIIKKLSYTGIIFFSFIIYIWPYTVYLGNIKAPSWISGYQVTPITAHALDWKKYEKLVKVLEDTILENETVYVAVSNSYLNNSVLKSAITRFDSGMLKPDQIIKAIPQIDKRDFFIVNKFISADYIIASNPVQYHLKPESQKIVKYINEAIVNDNALGEYYEAVGLSMDFKSNKGFKVTLYKRIRKIPLDKAVAFLSKFDREVSISMPVRLYTVTPSVNSRLGLKSDDYWVSSGDVSDVPRYYFFATEKNITRLNMNLFFPNTCGDVSIEVRSAFNDETLHDSFLYRPEDSGSEARLILQPQKKPGLIMEVQSAHRCKFYFKNLRAELL